MFLVLAGLSFGVAGFAVAVHFSLVLAGFTLRACWVSRIGDES